MYHTFQASSTPATQSEGEGVVKSPRPNRRISTSNACIECRRRKIRCDGNQPCGQCLWYQHPELCGYVKQAQRVVPSKKLVEKLQFQVDRYHAVFARLFPGKELDDILSLPREGLINLAVTLPTTKESPNVTPEHMYRISEKSEEAESFEELELNLKPDPGADEAPRGNLQSISDDVHGLSLSADKGSAYVGVSSINAAIKVILKTAPAARPFISQAAAESSEHGSGHSQQREDPDPYGLPPLDIGQMLIDSYFMRVHPIVPMIDEEQFRHIYLHDNRGDTPWLALLNTVLALGALASSTADNEDHLIFAQRARRNLVMETFGSSSLLMLQALGLFCGYYLHWMNRPNEANGLMGGALRMATAHGLHKEYGDGTKLVFKAGCPGAQIPAEIRRRTWWSLFCMDCWANTTTGRPSLGRTGFGITVQMPRSPQYLSNGEHLASLRLLPIVHDVALCRIATKAQDILALKSIIGFEELFALEIELEKWHEELPPIMRLSSSDLQTARRQDSAVQDNSDSSSRKPSPDRSKRKGIDFSQPPEWDQTDCPDFLRTPRAILHWRYQNLRILINRPWLLATALRRTSYHNMSIEEKLAVSRCRIIASQTIIDIDASCEESVIAGWNGVWAMYQAVMVPLVSLFSVLSLASAENSRSTTPRSENETAAPSGDEDLERWRRDIETSIAFFDRMQAWSTAAKKIRDVVQRLYDATKVMSDRRPTSHQQQQETLGRGQSTAPSHFIKSEEFARTAFTPPFETTNPPFAAANLMQGNSSMPAETWTNGQFEQTGIHVNDFWDEMMWDTLSSEPLAQTDFPESIAQLDWWGQNAAESQDWSQWPIDHQGMQ